MSNFFQQNKKGIISTLIFHGVVFVLLLHYGFTTQLPLPAEEGILINFGNQDFGSGNIEPAENLTINDNEFEASSEISAQDETTEDVLTQDFEDAASIETKKETESVEEKPEPIEETKDDNLKQTDNKEDEPEEKAEPERIINEKALFSGKNKDNNNSTSEGITQGEGNQGSLLGDPNSKDHSQGNSTGSGGISYSLQGRNPESLPKPIYLAKEHGKIVVEVTVDRYGNVTSATPGVKGSTTINKSLIKAAKDAALKAKFDKKLTAPAFQKGTITYHFVLQ